MLLKRVGFRGRLFCENIFLLFDDFFMCGFLVWPFDLMCYRMEKGKGKPGQFGSSGRDWYSGWNCMKNLIAKGLVVKSSCPAK